MENRINQLIKNFDSDQNYIALKEKYEKPNAFTIMGDKRREEWHSNFICWLLNPIENHRLGQYPLERFIELIERVAGNLTINKFDISNTILKTEVSFTCGRIDILAENSSLVMIVENKIKASETITSGCPQTVSYYDYFENNREYKNKQRCYVLLKPQDSKFKMENDNFINITYQDLFEDILRPSYLKSKEIGLEDTFKTLEQYILDISNPNSNFLMAVTQEELASLIFSKHEELFSEIKKYLENKEARQYKEIYKYFSENKRYINGVIMKSLKKDLLLEKAERMPAGDTLIKDFVNRNIIIPDQTEMVYRYGGATCITVINSNGKFNAGIYRDNDKHTYDGSQKVMPLINPMTNTYEFDTSLSARIEMERALGSKNSNPGEIVSNLSLINSGVKEFEGKTMKMIWDNL